MRFEPKLEDVTICRFPKYQGRFWVDVIEEDIKYVEWLVFEYDELDEDIYEYLMDLLET